MFTIDEFYAALQNGTDPEQIAKEFTDALNGAVTKQKQAAAEEKKVKEDRIFVLECIIDEVADFVKDFYPDMYNKELFDGISVVDLDQAIQDAYVEAMQMVPLFDQLKKMTENLDDKNTNKKVTVKVSKDTDKAINDFLKKYGL